MGRKGEGRGRWSRSGSERPPPGSRPGDGPAAWIEPGGPGPERRDPFERPRPLGPKGYRRPDERIRDEVCERIARSGLDARDVEVSVKDGEVTLEGTVERREDKRALEDLADDVFGVEDVHNRLRLARRIELTGSLLSAGSGTTGTGAAMSAQQRRRRGRARRDPAGTH